MTEEEWSDWQSAHSRIPWAHVRVASPCRDCLVPFHRQMQAEGRCDGFPGSSSPVPDTPQRAYWREASRRALARREAGLVRAEANP